MATVVKGAENRVLAFMYLLLRDHVPAGTAEKVAVQAEMIGARFEQTELSNDHLAAYSREVLERLGVELTA